MKTNKWIWEKVEIELTNPQGETINLNSADLDDYTFDLVAQAVEKYVIDQGGELEWDILSIVQAPKTWYQRTMNRADIEDLYGDDEPNICFAEGFDEAIAGVVWDGERTRVVYDTELILELLMGRSEMSYEEAVEYFDYNIAGSYMGEYTPLYLET